jgi:hypothetical protein
MLFKINPCRFLFRSQVNRSLFSGMPAMNFAKKVIVEAKGMEDEF